MAADDPHKQRLAATRAFILEVLNGRITPDTKPTTFEEDIFVHSILALYMDDREWLEAQIRDERYPKAARDLVIESMPQES